MKALSIAGALKGFRDQNLAGNAEPALTAIRSPGSRRKTRTLCFQLIEENVLLQITHLKTHPFVAARLRPKERFPSHGWVYDIGQAMSGCMIRFGPVRLHRRGTGHLDGRSMNRR
jgi:carbonic anhydrase